MKACYAEQMRAIDRSASEIGGIPSIVLMENAAIACVEELKKDFGSLKEKSILILCGKGNNGGDGFAIARHLTLLGANVSVALTSGDEFKGDAEINYNIIVNMNVPIISEYEPMELEGNIRCSDIIIDAIFGTGIHGVISGVPAETIELVNSFNKYVLSVDIPSGINADTGEICGGCIHATKTVTFAAWKIGMLLYPGADCTGEVVTAPISIPQSIIDMNEASINVIDDDFLKENYPSRRRDTNKSSYGKIFIIAGSRGMSGAAYMSSQSALYGGAGLVTVGICESISSAMEAKTTEAMTLVLDDCDGHIAYTAEPEILRQLEKCDTVLIGPGLGRSREAARIVKTVLTESRVPVIVDADALYAVSQNIGMLRECSCPLIFTPHEMEMARLINEDVEYVRSHRIEVSREFCEKYGVTLILKGSHTLITAPDLTQYINITGNPGMATGGSGDVLAGLTAALTARISDETKAAATAVYLHGIAGDIAAKKYGMDGMTAVDIMECLRNP